MKAITKIKLKLLLMDILFEIVVNSIIIGFAILSKRILIAGIFYLCWVVFRYAVPKVFHVKHSNPWISICGCGVCSSIIAIMVISTTLPLTMSILSGVVINAFVNFVLYKIQDYLYLKMFHVKHTNFAVENATNEQIVEICKSLHYKKNKIDLAVKFFVEKWSNKQVLEWMCDTKQNVEYDTVIQYRYRILKDLKKFEKTK